MTTTILITGFGPFPGAPYNPTGPLVSELARRRHPAFANVRRVAHVFPVSYEAVDRELPALLKRERPDALIMFGLAVRATQMRIEMRARNAVTRMLPDVSGRIPLAATILPGGPPTVPMRSPAQRLLAAADNIKPVIPLVGRIDVANFPRNASFIGTGWLIAP